MRMDDVRMPNTNQVSCVCKEALKQQCICQDSLPCGRLVLLVDGAEGGGVHTWCVEQSIEQKQALAVLAVLAMCTTSIPYDSKLPDMYPYTYVCRPFIEHNFHSHRRISKPPMALHVCIHQTLWLCMHVKGNISMFTARR